MLFEPEEVQAVTFTIEESVAQQRAGRHARFQNASGPVCPYWRKGTCRSGAACRMRHTRTATVNAVCKHWLRGLCKRDDACEFLHVYDLDKMQPCHFYVNFGACSNPDCYFLHIRPEEGKMIRDCPWYTRGFCKLGPACKSAHRRLQACPAYLAGLCTKGPDCELGHPKGR